MICLLSAAVYYHLTTFIPDAVDVAQLDRLDVTDRHYDRKYQDMQDRLDTLYDRIADLEEKIDDVTDKISGVYDENLTSKQLCKVFLQFDEIFEEMTDLERKEFYIHLLRGLTCFLKDRKMETS